MTASYFVSRFSVCHKTSQLPAKVPTLLKGVLKIHYLIIFLNSLPNYVLSENLVGYNETI